MTIFITFLKKFHHIQKKSTDGYAIHLPTLTHLFSILHFTIDENRKTVRLIARRVLGRYPYKATTHLQLSELHEQNRLRFCIWALARFGKRDFNVFKVFKIYK